MRRALALLPIAVLLNLAPAASAGSLTTVAGTPTEGATAYLHGDPGQAGDLSVVYEPATATVRFRDSSAPLDLSAAVECTRVDAHEATCPARDVRTVELVGDTGEDTLASSVAPSAPFAVGMDGGDGDDHLVVVAGGARLDGGGGDDVLEGGPRSDTLDGGPGVDVLRGGDGDDRLLADEGPGSPGVADAEVACGPGAGDWFLGDAGVDVRAGDCELQLAQFTGPPAVAGQPRVGEPAGLSLPLIGIPTPSVSVTWFACYDAAGVDCAQRGTGRTYTPTARDVGLRLVAYLHVHNDVPISGRSPVEAWTAASLPVMPVPVAVVPPTVRTRTPGSVPAPNVLPPRPSASSLATTALGGPVALAGGVRSPVFGLYVPAGRNGVLRVGAQPVAALAVVGKSYLPGQVVQTLELTPRRGHAVRKVRLVRTGMAVAMDAATVVRVRLSAAQRRLVRAARAAKVVITVGGTVAGRPVPAAETKLALRL